MDSVPEENGFPKISIGIGILVLELSFLEPFLFDEVKRDGNKITPLRKCTYQILTHYQLAKANGRWG